MILIIICLTSKVLYEQRMNVLLFAEPDPTEHDKAVTDTRRNPDNPDSDSEAADGQ